MVRDSNQEQALVLPHQPGQARPEGSPSADGPSRPSRCGYFVAAAILVLSLSVFVLVVEQGRRSTRAAVEAMPRLVGPTGGGGVELTLPEAGEYAVYYENLGTLPGREGEGDRVFDTPRLQVWTTPTRASMSCSVTPVRDGVSQDPLDVRLLGQSGNVPATLDAGRDVAVIYDLEARQGAGVWTFTVAEPGPYRIAVSYLDAVDLDTGAVTVPEALTRGEQSQMRFEDVEQHEQQRAEAISSDALASLEPVDVLFAVGQDPTAGAYFNVLGLKGAATLLAFGLTASVVIALVTWMLRAGQVTRRGTMEDVQRGWRA